MPRKTKKEMIGYITGYNTYWTMNSWNGLIGYSRCIKLYKLPLTKEETDRAYEIICDKDLSTVLWEEMRWLIEVFREETGIHVFTNGRSGGYLVMESHFRDGFPVKDKQELKEMRYDEVREIYNILKRFDRLYEDMVATLKYYCSLPITEETYTVVKTRKVFNEVA
ncbi:hypothetical protein Psch_03529 [Pelotomaculum schinkii]|uniref:Uncharacterized protein n=1 Tax=Pelotomaculum schinkii TaxID=78350 RepID=A0A4Y7R7E8_9FIRM|nr:hypothetical protein [Pelotomaculum schinkii]TEB04767.1 hypothetical protein Psch_03529 [Pelotomaculum schinkii]